VAAPPRNWPLDATRAGLLVGAVALHGLLGLALADAFGTEEFARRDWLAFREAGRGVLAGDALYEPRPGGFPFLHPPYVAAILAPLGPLSDGAFFLTMTALSLGGLGLFVLALRRLQPVHEEHDVVLLGLLASAPWAIGLVLGQPSGLVLGGWLAAFWLVDRDRPLAAGVLFGLCAIKPPYVVAPIVYALLSRRYRILGGVGLTTLALLALSLAVGQWREWVAAVARVLGDVGDGEVMLWKQHTLLAFLRGLLPRPVALGVWGVVWLGFLGLFFRVRDVTMPMLRVAGWLALGTIALSPFAYFYDALLLVIPAAALWLNRETYPPRYLPGLAALVALTFATQHVGFFVIQAGPLPTGLLATAWLLLEMLAIRGSAHHRVAELDGEPDGDA